MLTASLDKLPYEIIVKIFSYLCARDLFTLSRVNSHLCRIVSWKGLWCHVDCGPSPVSLQYLHRLLRYTGGHTVSISITGFVKSKAKSRPKGHQCISEALLNRIKLRCPCLTELKLHRCYIDASITKFSTLPPSLKKLSLDHSFLFNLPVVCKDAVLTGQLLYFHFSFKNRIAVHSSPFYRLEKAVPVLQSIDISGCSNWIVPLDLQLLMKSHSLLVVDTGMACFVRRGISHWENIQNIS